MLFFKRGEKLAMKKMEKALMILTLGVAFLITGGSFASMQDNTNSPQNGNQNGNRGGGNGNMTGNRNMNGNMGGNMNGDMMNANMNNTNMQNNMGGNMNSGVGAMGGNMMMNENMVTYISPQVHTKTAMPTRLLDPLEMLHFLQDLLSVSSVLLVKGKLTLFLQS